MARKIIDTYPVITLTVGGEVSKFASCRMSPEEAADAQAEFLDLLKTVLRATRRRFDVESRVEEAAACEHCRSAWTEASPDYNGGCCALDEANNPDRLAEIRELAEIVEGADLYRLEEDGRGSPVAIAWPGTLATAALKWLDDGRPAEDAAALLPLIKRVRDSDWCTVCGDPGVYPSNAGGGPLPDRIELSHATDYLALGLTSLLDDMGLLTAQAGKGA